MRVVGGTVGFRITMRLFAGDHRKDRGGSRGGSVVVISAAVTTAGVQLLGHLGPFGQDIGVGKITGTRMGEGIAEVVGLFNEPGGVTHGRKLHEDAHASGVIGGQEIVAQKLQHGHEKEIDELKTCLIGENGVPQNQQVLRR